MGLNKKKLTVGGVPEHFNLPWHLAIESDAASQIGIDIEFCQMPGGTGQMTRGLREQELDVAILLTEGGVADILNGNPSKLVKVYVETPLIWGIHVAANSDLHTIDDIKGKRYAISRFGSGSHLMPIVDSAERGWDTESMQFEKVGDLAGARRALASGEADVFFWERFTTAPLVESGEFRRLADRLTLWPAFMICVRQEVLESYASELVQLLSIVDAHSQQLKTDPSACDMFANRYGLRPDEVKQWLDQTDWSRDFRRPENQLEKVLHYLQKLEIVTAAQADSIDVWFDLETSDKAP